MFDFELPLLRWTILQKKKKMKIQFFGYHLTTGQILSKTMETWNYQAFRPYWTKEQRPRKEYKRYGKHQMYWTIKEINKNLSFSLTFLILFVKLYFNAIWNFK